MSYVQFTRSAARRIASVVRIVEQWRRPAPARQRRFAAGSEITLCVFKGNLRPDGDEVAGTPYVLALRRYPTDPGEETDLTFETDEEGSEFEVWPWQIPDGYQIPEEWEVWVIFQGGRWYPLMPEDCLQPIPEE